MKQNAPPRDTSFDSIVGQVAEDFIARLNRGEQPEIDEYVKHHPEIAATIRQVFPALQIMRTRPSGDDSSKDRPAAGASVTGQLGDYRIIREIGRGGMGVVYEAEQVSLGRRVALKVLPFAAVLDQRQLQRFKNEAQAAAQLHHQNVVPVYSVGCERGVHFYAMQYIEGQTLGSVIQELSHISGLKDATSDELSRLTSEPTRTLTSGAWVPARDSDSAGSPVPPGDGSSAAVEALASEYSTKSPAFFRSIAHLGVQAAEGLEHAHHSGVIHRDIKPSNLLLDGHGHVWITDFGLARLESEPGMTMTGDILGTVRYMSPEQALAKRIPIDHRTDIYSLGVTLYELLTLRPAFTGQDRQELLRQIAFEEPRQPRRLNSAIPTELETIVLKAVAKNPAERYDTARELADDLGRFLEDKPIKAKRPSLMERVGKWSRRHRTVVAAGVVLLVMAVVALSVSTVLIWQEQARTQAALDQVEEQRERAATNFQKAREAVDQMLAQVAQELSTLPRPAHQLDMFWRTRGVYDPAMMPVLDSPGPASPFARVRFTREVDEVKQGILDDALAYYRWFLQERSGDPSMRYETARAYLHVGQITRNMRQYDSAAETYGSAIKLLDELATEFPHVAVYRNDLGAAERSLGTLHQERGDLPAAEHALDRAARTYEKLTIDFPDEPDYARDLAASLRYFSYLLGEFGRFGEAEAVLRRAVKLNEKLATELPEARDYRAELVRTYLGLGSLLRRMERFADAEEIFHRAIDVQTDVVQEVPHKSEQRLLVTCYRWLNLILKDTGRSDDAVESCRSALEMAHDLTDQFPNEPDYRLLLCGAYQDLGEMSLDLEHFDEAERAYRRAVALAEELLSEFPESNEYDAALYSTRTGLSVVLRENGRIQEADEIYRKLLGRWGTLGAELHISAKHSVNGVAEAVERVRSIDAATPMEPYSLLACAEYLLLGGDPDAAVAAIQRAIGGVGIEVRSYSEHSYYKDLGWALLSAGREEEAGAAFNTALAGFETWAPTASDKANADHWTAAYFLDLVSQEQYTRRWRNVRAIFARMDSLPWFYVGQRAEIEGRIDDAISAYQTAVELGKAPSPHITANYAAYRLQVLTGDGNQDDLGEREERIEPLEE